MKHENMNFPIFVFGKTDQKNMIGEENMIYAIKDAKSLNITKLYVVKSGYFVNQEIVDSLGYVYKVKNVEFVKFVGIGNFLPFLGNKRIVEVSFTYQDNVDTITLNNFKKRIIPMIEKMKDYWEEGYGDVEELNELIMNSKSFEEIADLLK